MDISCLGKMSGAPRTLNVSALSTATDGANVTVGGRFVVLAGEFSPGVYVAVEAGKYVPARVNTIWELNGIPRKAGCAPTKPQGKLWLRRNFAGAGEIVAVPFATLEEAEAFRDAQSDGQGNVAKGGDKPTRSYFTILGPAVVSQQTFTVQPGCREVLVVNHGPGLLVVSDTPTRAVVAAGTIGRIKVGASRVMTPRDGVFGYATDAATEFDVQEEIYE